MSSVKREWKDKSTIKDSEQQWNIYKAFELYKVIEASV